MNILVIGASGQLGRALVAQFSGLHEVQAVDIEECPVEDRQQVMEVVRRSQAAVILNAAAYTDVDGCERDPDRAYQVNALGPRNLAIAAREGGCRLVHFSTDFVFSGRRHVPYVEWDDPGPVNVYGQTKLLGERFVLGVSSNALICRVAWLLGEGNRNTFVGLMADLAKKKPVLDVVRDQVGCPTYTVDVAKQVALLLEKEEEGVFHVVSRGGCSRYDLVRFVVDQVAPGECEVRPVNSAMFPTPARRPEDTRLHCRMLDLLGVNIMPDWQEAVAQHLKTL